MYGQLHEPNVNASAPAIRSISQIAHNIRHGLNGPAIVAPNHEHMAHHHTQHVPQAQSLNQVSVQQQQQQQQPHRQNSRQDKDRINVLAIPSSTVVGSQVIIGDASSSQFTPLSLLLLPQMLIVLNQHRSDPIRPSKVLEMAPSEQSGSATGIPRSHPLSAWPLCSKVQEQSQSGRENASLL